MKLKMLSTALCALLASTTFAAETAKPGAAEQQAAKAEIESLMARIEELSKKLGPDSPMKLKIHRIHSDGPPSPDMQGKNRVMIERLEGALGSMQPKPGVGIVMSPNAAANGVLIGAVTPNGPAAKAGLRTGDVLLAVDGKYIGASGKEGLDDARQLLSNLKVGQNVQLTYARAGKTGKASVKADNISRVMMLGDRANSFSFAPDGNARTIVMRSPGNRDNVEIMAFADCEKSGKENCAPPRIFEAMRWNGLNLASLDAQLGRYFGTEKGVLVISAGPGMKTLQGGDVIQRVENTATESPRDVMRLLRDKKAGDNVKLSVLRDRKLLNLEVTSPEAKAMQFLPPPAPPAPPAPPRAPTPAPPAPPAPPMGLLLENGSTDNMVWISHSDASDSADVLELEIETSK